MTDSTGKVEEVARAIVAEMEAQTGVRVSSDPAMSAMAAKVARAAIAASDAWNTKAGYVTVPREPSPQMLAAVKPFPEHLRAGRDDEWIAKMEAATVSDQLALRQQWIDLIDAALAE